MRIPTYERKENAEAHQIQKFQVSNQTPDMRLQVNADMFGGAQARALGQAGNDLQRAGALGVRAAAEWEYTNAQAAMNAKAAEDAEALYGENGFLNRKGKAAVNAPADLQKYMAESESKYAGQAGGSWGKAYFKQMVEKQTQQLLPRAMQHATLEKQNFAVSTHLSRAGLNADEALRNAADPELFSAHHAEGLMNITLAGRAKGQPDEEIEGNRRKYSSQLYMGKVQGLLTAGKIGEAQKVAGSGFLMGEHDLQAQGWIKAEQERIESEAKVAQTLRNMEVRQLASMAPDRLSYGVQTKDFGAAEKTAAELERLGATTEAAELRGSIGIQQTALSIVDGLRGMPLLEQRAEAEKQFSSHLQPDNAREVGGVREATLRTLDSHEAAFIKDPAAYAAQVLVLDPAMPMRERLKRSLETQQELGQGMDFIPKFLSKAQGLRIKNQYDSTADPAQKLQLVRGLQEDAGEYFSQVAREAKLPESIVQLSPVLNSLPDKMGGLLLSAAETSWDAIPKADGETSKNDAQQAAANSALAMMQYSLYKAMPHDAGNAGRAKHLIDTLGKAHLMGLDLNALDGQYDIVNDSRMFLAIPKENRVNMDDLTDAIQVKMADVQRMQPQGPVAEGILARAWYGNLDRLSADGLWISDNKGENVYLVDPSTGRQVEDVDGGPVRLRIADISKYKNRVQHDPSIRGY